MYSTFGGFAGYFKKKVSFIDNGTFRLHYRATFGILVAGSLLVTLSQFFGGQIQCIVGGGIPDGKLYLMLCFCCLKRIMLSS